MQQYNLIVIGTMVWRNQKVGRQCLQRWHDHFGWHGGWTREDHRGDLSEYEFDAVDFRSPWHAKHGGFKKLAWYKWHSQRVVGMGRSEGDPREVRPPSSDLPLSLETFGWHPDRPMPYPTILGVPCLVDVPKLVGTGELGSSGRMTFDTELDLVG
jgi:hypothetical protein